MPLREQSIFTVEITGLPSVDKMLSYVKPGGAYSNH